MHRWPPILAFAICVLISEVSASQCDLKKVGAKNGEVSAKFNRKFRHRSPVLIKNLTEKWSARRIWATQESFLASYGDLQVELREQVLPDELDSARPPSSVRDYLGDDVHHNMIQFSSAALTTYRRLRFDYSPLPKVLESIHYKPVFSLGRNGTGSGLHSHSEAWIAQIAGRKLWLLVPPSTQLTHTDLTRLPCDLTVNRHAWPRSAMLCQVMPGEVIYLPGDWSHATCNIDDFTLGIGGQGDSGKWPSYLHHVQAGDEQALRLALAQPGIVEKMRHEVSDPMPLHLAAREGPLSIFDLLLSEGVDPGARDLKGFQAIHHAAYGGAVEMLKHMMEHGHATVYDRSDSELDVLTLTAMGGHVSALAFLLDTAGRNKAKLLAGAANPQRQPLHYAALHGHLTVTKFLVQQQADILSVDQSGFSAVELARQHRHGAVVDFLTKVEENRRHRDL